MCVLAEEKSFFRWSVVVVMMLVVLYIFLL